MRFTGYWKGALLGAALPLLWQTAFCQTSENTKVRELLQFTLNESPGQIVKLLGRPDHVDDSMPGYQSWQYEFRADESSDDNSPQAWYVCLRTTDHQILSVTRNFDAPQDVDELFPAAQTTAHHWPAEGAAQFSVRLRRLEGETLLLAMGSGKAGERTSQLMLIRRSALKTFMPWLAEQVR